MAVNDDFSSKDSRVHIFATENAVFEATATAITELIGAALSKNRVSNVIIASGNSIISTLGFLSASATDWRKVNWYLADERCVADDDDRRNEKQITDALRRSLGVNHGRVFSPSSRLLPAEAASEYASRISAISMFDFCLLGMGNDGHVASLLQNHSALNSSQLCCEIVDSPNPPAERITLTLKTFGQIHDRILVTAGSSKSTAIHDFIANSRSPVRLYNPTAIFADQAAYS